LWPAGADESITCLADDVLARDRLGYVVGQNIIIEYRSAEGKPERIPELAAELVRRKVDVIVTWTGTVAIAARTLRKQSPS